MTDTSAIAALFYIGVQVFEHSFASSFTAVPEQHATIGTRRYESIHQFNLLSRIPASWVVPNRLSGSSLELTREDKASFDRLKQNDTKLDNAMKFFVKRRGKGAPSAEEEFGEG